MPRRGYTVDHPDFPQIDWRPIAKKYGIFRVDPDTVDPEHPFGITKKSKRDNFWDVPCMYDTAEYHWKYPSCTARRIAVAEYFILRYERHRKMRERRLDPKPMFKCSGYAAAGKVAMERGILNKFYSWQAKQERAQQFPEEVAAEKRKTKSKLLPIG